MSLQYPISYFVLSATCFGCTTVAVIKDRYLPIAAIVAWIGLSFLLMAITYLLNWPGLLGKRESGGRNPLAWLLFGPYLMVSSMSQSLSRSKAAYSEIAPGLFMGRHLGDEEAEKMIQTTGVRTVIDLAAEHTEAAMFRLADYQSIPVLDAMPPTIDQLTTAVLTIQKGLTKGPVFVHCALGFGRSGAVAATYLIAIGQATDVKNAISQLKRFRPGVILSQGQRDAVTEAALKLKKANQKV